VHRLREKSSNFERLLKRENVHRTRRTIEVPSICDRTAARFPKRRQLKKIFGFDYALLLMFKIKRSESLLMDFADIAVQSVKLSMALKNSETGNVCSYRRHAISSSGLGFSVEKEGDS
jgi:hypothetical protein